MAVTPPGGGTTITLPTPSLAQAGQIYEIVDEGGLAATNGIVVTAPGAVQLAGVAGGSIVFRVNRASLRLYTNSINYFLLTPFAFAPTQQSVASPVAAGAALHTIVPTTPFAPPVGATRYVASVQTRAITNGTILPTGLDAATLPAVGNCSSAATLTFGVQWLSLAAAVAGDVSAVVTVQWF